MNDEPTYCGFCKARIVNHGWHRMEVWTEDGRVRGIILRLNGVEVRHRCHPRPS